MRPPKRARKSRFANAEPRSEPESDSRKNDFLFTVCEFIIWSSAHKYIYRHIGMHVYMRTHTHTHDRAHTQAHSPSHIMCPYDLNVLGQKLRMVREAGPELAYGTREIKKDCLEEADWS